MARFGDPTAAPVIPHMGWNTRPPGSLLFKGLIRKPGSISCIPYAAQAGRDAGRTADLGYPPCALPGGGGGRAAGGHTVSSGEERRRGRGAAVELG